MFKKIYCLALEGEAITGVDWYADRSNRDSAIGTTGAEMEIQFDIQVLKTAAPSEITAAAEDAAWHKTYLTEEEAVEREYHEMCICNAIPYRVVPEAISTV